MPGYVIDIIFPGISLNYPGKPGKSWKRRFLKASTTYPPIFRRFPGLGVRWCIRPRWNWFKCPYYGIQPFWVTYPKIVHLEAKLWKFILSWYNLCYFMKWNSTSSPHDKLSISGRLQQNSARMIFKSLENFILHLLGENSKTLPCKWFANDHS